MIQPPGTSALATRWTQLARLAVAEHDCCAFFDFNLSFAAGSILLEVNAPGAALALLGELLGGQS